MTLGYPQTIAPPRRRRRSLRSRATGRDSILRRFDWVLFIAALGLSIAGAVFVYSATRVVSAGEDPQAYLKRHLLNLVIGLGLGFATMLFDYRTLRAYAPFVYVASVIGLIAVSRCRHGGERGPGVDPAARRVLDPAVGVHEGRAGGGAGDAARRTSRR